jgi:protein TonB
MRRSFTLFSVVFHAVAISAALIAQVLAVGSLPTPHQPILFDPSSIMPAEIRVPPPPRRAAPSASASASASISAAPIVAPDSVTDESGRESVSTPAPAGLIAGVEGGPPSSSIDGVGVATVAPPPPEPAAAPIRLPSGIRAPVKTVDIAPIYPAIARSAHIQGIVILEAVLDASGRVDDVHVLRSIPLLDQAAIEAVRQWRYTPTLLNGRAIPIVLTVTVSFTLQ